MDLKNIEAASHFLKYKNSSIHYLKFGEGAEVLFAFHGFSENSKSFIFLEKSLKKRFTVYSIDFPYHGKTEWQEDHYFDRPDLYEIINLFRYELKIDRFSIIAFSMGGRMSLNLLHSFGSKINSLILIAPDGIDTHKVFDVAVYPGWGQWLFKKVMLKPQLFFFIVKLLFKTRIVSKFLYEFTLNHMNTEEKRQRIFNTWVSIKNFDVDNEAVKEILNKHQIKLFLFFGKYDEVIRPEVGEKFSKGLNNCDFIIVPKGHLMIKESFNQYLEKALQ